MEGNACYKFSTIANYLSATGAAPVRLGIDVGCNTGAMSRMMREYFPEAFIFALEPVEEYYERACEVLARDAGIKVLPIALSSAHRFADDLGETAQPSDAELRIFKALPESGPGWMGGSRLLRSGEKPGCENGYAPSVGAKRIVTLDELVEAVCIFAGQREVDYIKMDCEGCECGALGCARVETLKRIRFISGEFHNIDRFYPVMEKKLYATHHVNLTGGRWGSFFAERKGSERTILASHRDGMLQLRPGLSERPIDWHVFREEFVLPEERPFHGL